MPSLLSIGNRASEPHCPLPVAGWGRRAALWQVCASATQMWRIHPDNHRRDVCATRHMARTSRQPSSGRMRHPRTSSPSSPRRASRRSLCRHICLSAIEPPSHTAPCPSPGGADVPLCGMSALQRLRCGAYIPTAIVGTYAPPAIRRRADLLRSADLLPPKAEPIRRERRFPKLMKLRHSDTPMRHSAMRVSRRNILK